VVQTKFAQARDVSDMLLGPNAYEFCLVEVMCWQSGGCKEAMFFEHVGQGRVQVDYELVCFGVGLCPLFGGKLALAVACYCFSCEWDKVGDDCFSFTKQVGWEIMVRVHNCFQLLEQRVVRICEGNCRLVPVCGSM